MRNLFGYAWKHLGAMLLAAAGTFAIPAGATDCPSCSVAVKPESGFWHTPGAPGSGFAFRIYGSTLAGGHFGFDGRQHRWLTFSGTLQPLGESAGWRVESDLFAASGTGCFGCVTAQDDVRAVGSIEFEFLSRTTGRYRAAGQAWNRLELFTFGVDGYAEFSPAVPTSIPDLDGPWVLVFTSPSAGHITARYYSQNAWAYGDGSRDDGIVAYIFTYSDSVPEAEPIANLACRVAAGQPSCSFEQYFDRFGSMIRPPAEFEIDLQDLSPTRFKGHGQDGATVEGFRIGVD